MKKQLHDYYFEILDGFLEEAKTKTREELIETFRHANQGHPEWVGPLADTLLGKDVEMDLRDNLMAVHAYMAKEFKKSKTVLMLERDLALALVNTSYRGVFPADAFPSNSFILYPNISHADIGHPEMDQVERIEAIHVQWHEKGDHYLLRIADLRTVVKEWSSDKMTPPEHIHCSGYTFMTIRKDHEFSNEALAEVLRDRRNDQYVGEDQTLNTKEYKDVFLKMRDVIINLVFTLGAYLELQDDVEKVGPDWTHDYIKKISNPKKRRRAERQLKEEADYVVRYVGGKYKKYVQAQLAEAGYKKDYKYQIRVAGHFNYYWYGKRKDEAGNRIKGEVKKPVWIEPQIRLPHLPERESGEVWKIR